MKPRRIEKAIRRALRIMRRDLKRRRGWTFSRRDAFELESRLIAESLASGFLSVAFHDALFPKVLYACDVDESAYGPDDGDEEGYGSRPA